MKIKKIHILVFFLILDLIFLALNVWELMHTQNLTDKQIASDKRQLIIGILNAVAFSLLIYADLKGKNKTE